MTQHNIIGSERSGPHVVVRHYAKRRRPAFWWARTVLEAAICIFVVAVIWTGLSPS